MPCDGPLTAYRPRADASDKRLVFDKKLSGTGIGIKIPCGKCSGCKLEHSRQWAVRCMHEKRMHNASAFLTLTYDKDNLPANGSLVMSDFQNFMKRYRDRVGSCTAFPTRYFGCGEYGEKSLRPHYHILLLNRDIHDRKFYKKSGENNLYTSKWLDDVWGKGLTVVGDVTFDSAAYVARYCMKKITGKIAADHYGGRLPEFLNMSRKPGIGAGYFDRYKQELIDHDTIIVNGVAAALPRYYDTKIANLNMVDTIGGLYSAAERIKVLRRRKIDFATRKSEATNRRRVVREAVRAAKLSLKVRSL